MVVQGILFVSYSSRGHQLVFMYPASASSAASQSEQTGIRSRHRNGHEDDSNSGSPPIEILGSRHGIHGVPVDHCIQEYRHSKPRSFLGKQRPATMHTSESTNGSTNGLTSGLTTDSRMSSQLPSGLNHQYNGSQTPSNSSAGKTLASRGHANTIPSGISLAGTNAVSTATSSVSGTHLDFRSAQSSTLVMTAATLSKKQTHSRHGSHGPPEPKNKFLGLDCEFLSDILSPKVALCDKQFHLTVDNVDFVGHPTLLNADRPGTGLRFARMVQKRKLIASATSYRQSLGEIDSSSTFTAAVSDPSSSCVSEDKPSANAFSSKLPSPVDHHHHQLTMFNLVFALQPDGRGTSHHSKEVKNIYDHVVVKVTTALKYEQLRRGYIRTETELILAINDRYQVQNGGAGDPLELQSQILKSSSLARCLAHIYHAVHGQLPSFLEVNGSVSLALRMCGIIETQNTYPGSSSSTIDSYYASNSTISIPLEISSAYFNHPTLRPYQALLLLSDAEEILNTLPVDASPLLVELIQIVTPTLSFEELQTTLSCSLSQIYRLAAHLYVWSKAKIIHVVSNRNVYIVSPQAQLSELPKLSTEFSSRFPQMELVRILQDLSIPRPYSAIAHSKENRNLYLEIITFLLRKNLVVQLHMYIYLSVPARLLAKTPSPENGNVPWNPVSDHPSIFTDPGNLSEQEASWIATIANSQPPPLAALFTRLVPYFNGRIHVEEILFRESIARYATRL
ncbi:Nitrogen permease regulator 3 [Batrachochytrium dendrobatidis]|nr:Nitrogen permease regulator 3 [Batrachochytrium dendrobatidis]